MRVLVLFLALAGLLPLTASAADTTSARRYGTSETLSVQNARLSTSAVYGYCRKAGRSTRLFRTSSRHCWRGRRTR